MLEGSTQKESGISIPRAEFFHSFPPAGEVATFANNVIAPKLFWIVDIQDASDLHFRDMDFQHSEWSCAGSVENRSEMCESIIGNNAQEMGAVQVFGSDAITFESCSFQNLGNFALYDRSHNVTVANCTFRDLISGGVRIGGGSKYNDRGPFNCTVCDNTISDVGTQMVLPSAAGVVVACTSDISVEHNEISRTPLGGIMVGTQASFESPCPTT